MMWTKQLKETAIQLANNKELNESQTSIWSNSNLSLEQKQALAYSYGSTEVAQNKKEMNNPFWG